MAIYKSRGGIQLSKQLVITVDIQTYDLEYSERSEPSFNLPAFHPESP